MIIKIDHTYSINTLYIIVETTVDSVVNSHRVQYTRIWHPVKISPTVAKSWAFQLGISLIPSGLGCFSCTPLPVEEPHKHATDTVKFQPTIYIGFNTTEPWCINCKAQIGKANFWYGCWACFRLKNKCLEYYGHIVEPFHVNNLRNFIEKDLCMTRQQSLNPLIALSLICLLSPDHNWHIYVL